MRRLLWLLLTTACFAQTQGNVPRLHQSMVQTANGNPANQILLPDGVTAGQLIVTCSTNNNASAIAMSDTDGNSYTQQTLFAINAGGPSYMQMAYAVAAHTVSSLTITGTPGGSGSGFQTAGLSSVGVYDGLSGTTDGTASATTLASSGSVGTSVTTTVNGDGVIACASLDSSSGLQHGTPSPAAGVQYVARDDYYRSFQSFTVGGAAGSQSISDLIAGGTSTNFGMYVTAFKPAASITITTTALADCGNSLLCVQQLKAVGGTAAYTWSTTAGSWPTGCSNSSLNSSTGLISCTPTSNGTFTLTFRVTDGTVNTSTSLSFKVGATLSVPVISPNTFALPGNGGSVNIPIPCGSTVPILLVQGSDTHGTAGWVPPIDGANNNIVSTPSLPIIAVLPIGGQGNASLRAYLFGPVVNPGSYTFTLNVNTGSAVALHGWTLLATGVQAVVDDAVTGGAVDSNSSGTYNISSSYTTLVANQLLMQFAGNDQDGGITAPNDTISQTPFTPVVSAQSNGGFSNATVGSDLVLSPSTVSTTTSFTHTSSQENAGMTQFALRPAINTGATCNFGTGEKFRRYVF